MEPIGNPEMSVLNQITLRNIPADGRIPVNRSESLRVALTLLSSVSSFAPHMQRA
jgi:hypothetical protein